MWGPWCFFMVDFLSSWQRKGGTITRQLYASGVSNLYKKKKKKNMMEDESENRLWYWAFLVLLYFTSYPCWMTTIDMCAVEMCNLWLFGGERDLFLVSHFTYIKWGSIRSMIFSFASVEKLNTFCTGKRIQNWCSWQTGLINSNIIMPNTKNKQRDRERKSKAATHL